MMEKSLLSFNEIHVWSLKNKDHIHQISALQKILNDDELIRAERFQFEKDRNIFIIAHAVLRQLLGDYLEKDPLTLRFGHNQFGKPFLENNLKISFNISHSHSMILIAVTLNDAIGIDVEYMRKVRAIDEIVKRFFSDAEIHEYSRLKPDQKVLGFYNVWTRKEAFVKAIGKGINHYSLKKFSVNLTPGVDAKLLQVDSGSLTAGEWHLHGFQPYQGYCAALCWHGEEKEVIYQKY